MITIKDLRKVYQQGDKRIVALDGISLEVRQGEVFGVLGQSGAGKSTLIRCVNLLERPTSGSVLVGGQDMQALSAADLRRARQRIGMIFQHFNLLSSRTVADNVALPLEVMGYDRSRRLERVSELLNLVGLAGYEKAYPAQLSGGQKQRVGIARALAGEPSVLLCDEATSALDPQTTRSILDLLRELKQRLGLTILLITHEMGVVRQICDRVAVLNAGRIVEQGSVAELIAQPQSLLAREFFGRPALQPSGGAGTSLTITFLGSAADQPIISTLVRRYDLDINILGGSIEQLGDERIGQLHVELQGAQTQPALDYLRSLGLPVEVH